MWFNIIINNVAEAVCKKYIKKKYKDGKEEKAVLRRGLLLMSI